MFKGVHRRNEVLELLFVTSRHPYLTETSVYLFGLKIRVGTKINRDQILKQ